MDKRNYERHEWEEQTGTSTDFTGEATEEIEEYSLLVWYEYKYEFIVLHRAHSHLLVSTQSIFCTYL